MSARNSSSTNNLELSVRLNLLASFDAESEHSRQQRITPTEKKNENYFIFFFRRCNCTFTGLMIFDANLFLHKLGLSSFIFVSNL